MDLIMCLNVRLSGQNRKNPPTCKRTLFSLKFFLRTKTLVHYNAEGKYKFTLGILAGLAKVLVDTTRVLLLLAVPTRLGRRQVKVLKTYTCLPQKKHTSGGHLVGIMTVAIVPGSQQTHVNPLSWRKSQFVIVLLSLDLQRWAKRFAVWCVNSCLTARGSQQEGFTQPRTNSATL